MTDRMGRLPIIVAALLLAGCTSTAINDGLRLAKGVAYVAMGSSFASGAGIGPLRDGTPVRCARNTNNYASLLSERLGLTLTDASCSGATTAHVLGPWNELPPQIDALTNETRLVTITIGGNDLGYAGGLFGGSCRAGVSLGGRPCPPNALPHAGKLAQLEQSLRAIAKAVRVKSPKARLVFVQYVRLIPDQPCDAATITPEDARISREVGEKLAVLTAKVARESGALVLPADTLSKDHTPCSTAPWSNGFSKEFDASKGAPWHPNAAGHMAIADALGKLLG